MQRLETILENVRKNPKSLPLIERLTTTLHGKFQIGQGLDSDLFLVYTFSCSLFSSCPGRTAAGVAEAFAILSSLLCDGKSMRKSNLVLAEDRGAAIFDKQKERLE